MYTPLAFDPTNLGANVVLSEENTVASRRQGSVEAVAFCRNRVDYFEVEIVETIAKSQTRTAAFGFLWELPAVNLRRCGKNANELPTAVVVGGELPQVGVRTA